MRFYRPLAPFAAMTFDLDDTLYDNHPVIDKTEKEVLCFIRQYDTKFRHFEREDLHLYRQAVLEQAPDIYHDITLWRQQSVELMFRHHGFNHEETICGTDEIMACFMYWRNQIIVPESTHDTLSTLAKKIPLVAITNGNAEPAACGLSPYFTFVLKAGVNGRSKPCPDMYYLAAERLNLPINQILHVGDSLKTDVEGALCSGMQACWINLENKNLMQESEGRLVPHVEISDLASLIALI
ncbi:5-amino-6-(5-phospho-D-ribitylamino)uracil phosphatase YigB [Xenorhabdus nematophila]|uniref:5-amino-6-(5-phospho-D-ribitylamino)uracil phosphatase YigB n=1 Tax=Xenorhabdus nematophila TaxID=628 RepID=UPI00032755C0|nr:5-amino-6-(5-phospho-D-ribitylamino)uracil phosphatase YigB [Xenorhabdus nematophila]CEE90159.1 putative enzyme with a phosphatase-like domain [Xenorhabdus nematophila str. Anatoliense]CEF31615.1 putative enzyme with a phosphatase-like domain [Xenorhabdus nematophila str. Websteri]AYA41384.1 5-amino-6-(5-phospho-D-ribitylamino)uracil phosphatase YigB [Xenorhabdus nematophila]MBA0020121.1 5-amino-6-(5-phospho-D-ribitylamino)uracil phosphatase YigB [Xenorhabdus nematophila]MCB4423765.1 5-amin